ncbi:MAG: phosphopantetheinyl transferase (holo-ACP synthase) [Candidatus Omnitrophota bacterium]|jgi:phosphopantetheinyl transferase (holo-ACP synthase)
MIVCDTCTISDFPISEKKLKSIYCQAELKIANQRRFGAESLAARLAAKRACLRAFGALGHDIQLKDICFHKGVAGQPYIGSCSPNKILRRLMTKNKISISLTHTTSLASAICVISRK